MLNHEGALLILEQVSRPEIVAFEVDPDDEPTEWDATTYANIDVEVEILGQRFSLATQILVPNDRCPFADEAGFDVAVPSRALHVIALAMARDANSSAHRALKYRQLLDQARDRAARLDEVPAHIEGTAA